MKNLFYLLLAFIPFLASCVADFDTCSSIGTNSRLYVVAPLDSVSKFYFDRMRTAPLNAYTTVDGGMGIPRGSVSNWSTIADDYGDTCYVVTDSTLNLLKSGVHGKLCSAPVDGDGTVVLSEVKLWPFKSTSSTPTTGNWMDEIDFDDYTTVTDPSYAVDWSTLPLYDRGYERMGYFRSGYWENTMYRDQDLAMFTISYMPYIPAMHDGDQFLFIKDARSTSSTIFTYGRDKNDMKYSGYFVSTELNSHDYITPDISAFYVFVGFKFTTDINEAVNVAFFERGQQPSRWTQCDYDRDEDLNRGISGITLCMYKRSAMECSDTQIFALPAYGNCTKPQQFYCCDGVASTETCDGVNSTVQRLMFRNQYKPGDPRFYYWDNGQECRTAPAIIPIRQVYGSQSGITVGAGYTEGIFCQSISTDALKRVWAGYQSNIITNISSKFNK